MGLSLTHKILEAHVVNGRLKAGEPIELKVDQCLTQDATGTMAYLQFEAMGIPKIQLETCVSYVDHNMLQTSYRNPDDHIYLQTAASKFGAYFSKPGNGICHQVHLERFAAPGKILLGSDSHTPTAGGMGSIAIGVGGLNIATAMAGMPYEVTMPKVLKIHLIGKLERPWVTAMDIILELLRRLTVKGGVGKIVEYVGTGVKQLNLTERATITNMGAELGATTSIFQSDEETQKYLIAQGRGDAYKPLMPDIDADYDEEMEVDLSDLEPLVARPHSPDNVVKISELTGTKVDQVCVGSCTNSSYMVLKSVAEILKGRSIAQSLSMTITPGSKQVYEMIAKEGDLASMIGAGARILESACGPCIGMGAAPPSNGVSVRSFNRNFPGRSGNPTANVYLCNPFVATAIAIKGEICDPRDLNLDFNLPNIPDKFLINDNMIIPPARDPEKVDILKGPNIKDVPLPELLRESVKGEVLIKLGDNITTDDIMPAGSTVLPLRSNIPAISEYVFFNIDNTFPKRAKEVGGGVIVGGDNYGQGSSREHAALAPMYLGLKFVLAKSFARIHRSNLVNYGLLPLEFENKEDYELIDQGNLLEIENIETSIKSGKFEVINRTKDNFKIAVRAQFSEREKTVLLAGGLLRYSKEFQKNLKTCDNIK